MELTIREEVTNILFGRDGVLKATFSKYPNNNGGYKATLKGRVDSDMLLVLIGAVAENLSLEDLNNASKIVNQLLTERVKGVM